MNAARSRYRIPRKIARLARHAADVGDAHQRNGLITTSLECRNSPHELDAMPPPIAASFRAMQHAIFAARSHYDFYAYIVAFDSRQHADVRKAMPFRRAYDFQHGGRSALAYDTMAARQSAACWTAPSEAGAA